MDLVVLDIDLGIDRLAHGMNLEVEPVARPAFFDVTGPTRDMVAQLVEIAGNAPPGLFTAKLVRQVDVNWPLHGTQDEVPAVAFQSLSGFNAEMVRWLAILAIWFAVPAFAQQPQWNPAAPYVTAGQDEPGYRNWVGAASWRPLYVKAFHDYLTTNGVGGVVPTWQLLRTATDWQRCGAEPYEIPPTSSWPNIVAALRYVGTYVTPRIGPVEVVSVYRNSFLNSCAGGARQSTHLELGAIDMVPLRPITREALMTRLCQIHQLSGPRFLVGLGLYKGIRFHIDARKFREWGMAGSLGGRGCTAVLAEGPMPFQMEPPHVAAAPPAIQPMPAQR